MKLLIYIILTGLASGCALFKKTTRTSIEAKEALNRQVQADELAVRTGQKQTNVYTYWPDGSVYQWENRVEQVDEARFGALRVQEQAVAAREGTQVERVPYMKWVVIAVAVLVLIFMVAKIMVSLNHE